MSNEEEIETQFMWWFPCARHFVSPVECYFPNFTNIN